MIGKALLAVAVAAAVLVVPTQVVPSLADQQAAATRTGAHSGLPLPRFVTLNDSEARGLRRPDGDAPVDWIYTARGMPLQVTAEQGPWRRVRDPDGTQVWMHVSALTSEASVFVLGGHRREAILRRSPNPNGRAVAVLGYGVIGAVKGCEPGWVRVQVGDRAGWVRADAVWGAATCA